MISFTAALSYFRSTLVFIWTTVVTLPVITRRVAIKSYFHTKVSPSRQILNNAVKSMPNEQIVESRVTSAYGNTAKCPNAPIRIPPKPRKTQRREQQL